MSDLPLDRFRLFESQDVEETRELVARVFCDHELKLVGRGERLDTRMNCRRVRNMAIAAITYSGAVKVEPGECESFFPVMALLTGRGTFRSDAESLQAVPGLIPVVSPTAHLSMRLAAHTELVIARIERTSLELKLSELLDRRVTWPIRFSLAMDTSTLWGRGWYEAFRLCTLQLDTQGPDWAGTLAARSLESWLMEMLLFAQRSNYTDMLNGDVQPVPNRAVGIAIDIIQAHPEQPHSVGSLASAAGVSARALQEGFKRYAGKPPLTYLRGVRLQRAHDALRVALPGSTTVSKVAWHWGFPHVSRFAGFYRKKYGQTPSQTLQHNGPRKVDKGLR